MHAVKRFRSIAAGLVFTRAATTAVIVLLAAGLAVGYAVSWQLGVCSMGLQGADHGLHVPTC